jgi:DNA-binding MarR family transcriptional regulator
MRDYDYQQIDDVIHSRIRLAIMAVLMAVDEAEFIYLREKVKATDGNLSVHLKKLEDAKYINVKKSFSDRKPITHYKLTVSGRKAFEAYIDNLEKLIKP